MLFEGAVEFMLGCSLPENSHGSGPGLSSQNASGSPKMPIAQTVSMATLIGSIYSQGLKFGTYVKQQNEQACGANSSQLQTAPAAVKAAPVASAVNLAPNTVTRRGKIAPPVTTAAGEATIKHLPHSDGRTPSSHLNEPIASYPASMLGPVLRRSPNNSTISLNLSGAGGQSNAQSGVKRAYINGNSDDGLEACMENTSQGGQNTHESNTAFKGVKTVQQQSESDTPQYNAELIFLNRIISLGVFNSAEEAAKARDRAMIRVLGPSQCRSVDMNFELMTYINDSLESFQMFDHQFRMELFGTSWSGPKQVDFTCLIRDMPSSNAVTQQQLTPGKGSTSNSVHSSATKNIINSKKVKIEQ